MSDKKRKTSTVSSLPPSKKTLHGGFDKQISGEEGPVLLHMKPKDGRNAKLVNEDVVEEILHRDSCSVMLGFFYQLVDVCHYFPAPIRFMPNSLEGVEFTNITDLDPSNDVTDEFDFSAEEYDLNKSSTVFCDPCLLSKGSDLNILIDESLSLLEATDETEASGEGFEKNRVYLLSSSNGFLLCRKSQYTADGSTMTMSSYYIYNPITNQKDVLPDPPKFNLRAHVEAFICYPCLERVDYKVVRGTCSDLPGDYYCYLDVEIFSSETRVWTQLHLSSTIPYMFTPTVLGYTNTDTVMSGSETVCSPVVDASKSECYLIFSLKRKTNHLKIVPSPGPGNAKGVHSRLGQSQGCIRYMTYDMSDNLEIWELNEDYHCETNWTLKYSVSLPGLFLGSGDADFYLNLLSFHPFDPTLLLVYTIKHVWFVNLNIKRVRPIHQCPDSDNHFWIPYQWPCWPPI